jgi:effector-binding domain-containing protein
MGNYIHPRGKYLIGYKKGYYGENGDLPQRMVAYAEEHELVIKGPVCTVYLLDEVSMIDPDQYVARISVAVSDKKDKRR